ncbi:protein DA1 [Rhodococcoides kyotonense]|uniref:protein DA1 n=1 Tax=Rhodococcoides kyotonense TaxID=398843 RepID=UPI000A9321BF|nr:protein DA1 [Rhodococcus kyotonensis]
MSAGTALSTFRTALSSTGLRFGVKGLAVDLVPLSRPEHGLSDTIMGMTHSSFDGARWDHRVKISKYVPEFLFGAVLAHELGHVWIANSRFEIAPTHEQSEGICELFAHIWLLASGFDAQTERWVAQTVKRRDAYGKGYRWAASAFGVHRSPSVQANIADHFGAKGRNKPR